LPDLDAIVESVTAAAEAVHAVHPLIQQHVCPAIVECAGLPLGDIAHQQRVVETWYDLSTAYDTAHGDGFVLRALLMGDAATARELAVGFDAYNAGLRLVHAALDRLADLPPTDVA